MNGDIPSIMRQRVAQTIGDQPEHQELLTRFLAADPDTEEGLRTRIGCAARSDYLWNRKPPVRPTPNGFDGGQSGAMREGARLAA